HRDGGAFCPARIGRAAAREARYGRTAGPAGRSAHLRLSAAEPALPAALVALQPGAHADLVALGVGEHPERRRRLGADERAASVERGPDPRLTLVVRDRDVEMDPVALPARLIHLLEPDGWALAGRVDDRGVRLVVAGLVGIAEDGPPERPDGRDVHRVDRQ